MKLFLTSVVVLCIKYSSLCAATVAMDWMVTNGNGDVT